MPEITPKFVLDYIQSLQKLYKKYPVQTANRFNLPSGTIPNFNLEPYFSYDRGWAVLHRDVDTGQSYLTEFIEPPFAQDPALPPVEVDPDIPLTVPQYAPPSGYFVLIVENEGLPGGYAATTNLQIRTLANNDAVLNGGAGFYIPFRAQYELPVTGRLAIAPGGSEQQIRYDLNVNGTVKTLNGEYEAIGPFYAIIPKSGELHHYKVKWTKVDSTQDPIPTTPPTIITLPQAPAYTPKTPDVGINQAPPIFYPPTTERQPSPSPLRPSSYRLSPYKDADNTFRTNDIQQMFSFAPDPVSRKIIYDIGITSDAIKPTTYKIRNNTTNTSLKFVFSVPSFLYLDIPHIVIIKPLEELSFNVVFNETDAREKSITKTRIYTEQFTWSVEPVDVSAPILVMRNLPSVITSDNNLASQLKTLKTLNLNEIGVSGQNFSKYTTLYFTLTPTDVNLYVGERRSIKVDAWVGSGELTPNDQNSIQLQFEPNSIIWEIDTPTIMEINSGVGSINATLIGTSSGNTTFKAKVVKPPINMSLDKWNSLYNANTEIIGTGRRILVHPGVSGIEILGSANIYKLTS